MPYCFQPKGCTNNWTTSSYRLLWELWRQGGLSFTVQQWCSESPFPRCTIKWRARVQRDMKGRQPSSCVHRERDYNYLGCSPTIWIPLTTDVGVIGHDYVHATQRATTFTNSTPGYDWWCTFLRRWPQLSQRKPEHLSKHRAQGACPEARKNTLYYYWCDRNHRSATNNISELQYQVLFTSILKLTYRLLTAGWAH